MVEKRGQLTIFIIVGIVIVIGLVAFFVYQGGSEDRYFSQPGVADGVGSIDDYMVDCLSFASETSLNNVMMQGGYTDKPEKAEDFSEDEGTFLPYYYYEGQNYVPSIETIESEISKAVVEAAPYCVDIAEFSSFEISYTGVDVDVDVLDDSVKFVVDMPVKIESEGHVMLLQMKEHPITVPSRLKGMHNVAQYYVEDVSRGAMYCVNCLGELAIQNGVNVDVIGIGPTTSSVILSEDLGGTANFTYMFFLAKFTEEQLADPQVGL